jgi:predicted transcriptional regulator
MTRTQIQLPDTLYAQAKRIAERQEISLAELVRRGLEHMVRLYRVDDAPVAEWRLPDPVELGEFLAPVESWRELANAAGAANAEP